MMPGTARVGGAGRATKTLLLALLALALLPGSAAAADKVTFEAEAESTVYAGGAGRSGCGSCSGGAKVGNVYGPDAAFTMHGVGVPEASAYEVEISYLTADPRTVELSANGGAPQRLEFAPSGGWDVVAVKTVTLQLQAGANSLRFASAGGYSPDFDRIQIEGATPPAPAGTTFEAESDRSVRSGGAAIAGCARCSGGAKVGDLYGDAALAFGAIAVEQAGSYEVEIHYATADRRAARLTVNGGAPRTLEFEPSGGWDVVATTTVAVDLRAGENTIALDAGGGFAPDIDRIVVAGATVAPLPPLPSDPDAADPVPTDGTPSGPRRRTVRFGTRGVTISYHLGSGTADVRWPTTRGITGLYSAARIGDRFVSTKQYGGRCAYRDLVVTCAKPGLPTLRQRFSFDGEGGFFVRLEAEGEDLASNLMVPVLVDEAGTVDIGTRGDHRVLLVPVDNDHWVRYEARPATQTTPAQRSFEVSAFYDEHSRDGFVVGSVDRDQWKSGIVAAGTRRGELDRLQAAAGLTDFGYDYGDSANRFQFNRELRPHRTLQGDQIRSPRMYVGFFDDWRAGMETFGRHVADTVESRTWKRGTPFGYNSWGGLGARGGEPGAIQQVSDFMADELPAFRNTRPGSPGTYVGIDSYWDKLLDPQYAFEDPQTDWSALEQYVAHVKANGQEPALYFQPFAHFWLEGLDQRIGGTALCDGCPNQTLRQMALKVAGRPVQHDGAWALDPTNPGVLNRARIALTRFRELGVRYVKLDFLTHGYLESDAWFDPRVRTGLEAFHRGMRAITDYAGDDMFVDLAISPLFMSQYAHARRISCDVHGSLNNWHETEPDRYQKSTEYLLNSLTYGWWLDEVYAFNDGDHVQFGNYWYDRDNNARLFEPPQPRIWPESHNRARVTSAVITGIFLISEDFTADPLLRERARALLQNRDVNAIAEDGRSFRPVATDTGFGAASMFVRGDHLAVFNYGPAERTFAVDVRRLGHRPGRLRLTELWSGARSTAAGNRLALRVPGEDVRLYRISR